MSVVQFGNERNMESTEPITSFNRGTYPRFTQPCIMELLIVIDTDDVTVCEIYFIRQYIWGRALFVRVCVETHHQQLTAWKKHFRMPLRLRKMLFISSTDAPWRWASSMTASISRIISRSARSLMSPICRTEARAMVSDQRRRGEHFQNR